MEFRDPDARVHPIVPVREWHHMSLRILNPSKGNLKPFPSEEIRYMKDGGIAVREGKLCSQLPLSSAPATTQCPLQGLEDTRSSSILFMACCCYPKIACGFIRPCPPSRDKRMNGMQL